ncbi:MAG TPA: quinone oxidoreductase-like protein 1, partial [Acetobacteraceae bacterium]|nr:quinone oxidoreductase-like protein 1 [Acetobacteraceae bacterium]
SDAIFRLEPCPAPDPRLVAAPDLAAALAAAREADAARDLSESALLLEAFCTSAAHAALAAAPGPLDAPVPYRGALLEALRRDGLAEREAGGWRLLHDNPLPPAREIWRSVLATEPALAHELAWAARAAETLPAAIAGESVVHPAPDGAGTERLAAVLDAAVGAILADWPREQPLRVTELGAGGALTRRLLARLGAGRIAVRYTALGTPRAGALPAHAETVTLAWSAWAPRGEAPPPPPADLILGIGAAAAERHGTALAASLATLAAPGAALLLAEPLPSRLWDVCAGQDAAWWEDEALPDAPAWTAALHEAGWREPVAQPLKAAAWPAVLLAARAAGTAANTPGIARPLRLFAGGAPIPLAEALLAAARARGVPAILAPLDTAMRATPRDLRGAVVLALPGGDAVGAELHAIVRLAEAADGAAAAFAVVARDGSDPRGAAALALGGVLANERPGLAPRRIGCDPALPPSEAAERVLQALAADEPELFLHAHGRAAPRLLPGLPVPRVAGPQALGQAQPGQLGTLAWHAQAPRAPGPGEVLVRIEAAGLNFRDVMWAQGLLPEEFLHDGFAGAVLGMEGAGIVEAAGEGVLFRPGDRVFGFIPGAFATHAATRAEALAMLPDALTPQAAATIPVAFLTAAYALETLARLRPGETVLIHGGAGGVGLAA